MEKLHCQSALKKRMLQHLINVIDYLSTPLNAQHNYKKTKKSLERALLPRPAAYEAAAPLG
jgi:hypothetical protein